MIRKDIERFLKDVEKPGRYTGGEQGETIKNKENMDLRVVFAFPDLYEIGMSNLGMKILYSCLNKMENVWCERTFAPAIDMAEKMKVNKIPLYALESGDSVLDFDVFAITVQYEGLLTNILYLLDMANIPFYAKDRDESFPIILGGGPCTYNPEPFCEFFDILSIGEGEEALPELAELLIDCKNKKLSKKDTLLRVATELEGFYVPSLYEFSYDSDGKISEIKSHPDAPKKIKKRIVKNLDDAHYPTKQIIPYIETVHDRATIEIFRGCIRGCRFCQAGMIYRPVRERSAEVINEISKETVKNCGYEEISISSLSSSDYTNLPELTDKLLSWTNDEKINLSLPSLRLDSFTKELMDKVMSLRKSGLTFAVEAGTQRLRDVINKGVTEEDLFRSITWAFSEGRTSVKLYFMSGLPTETDEDVKAIADLSQQVVNLFYSSPNKPKGKGVNVNISVSCFVPKPFTPFQWEAQDTIEELKRKQMLLKDSITTKKINYTWHDARVSFIEAVLAKGDRRLSKTIVEAYNLGQKFDAWSEHFSFERWMKAFENTNVYPEFYANRKMEFDEILPWDIIDIGVSKEFLIRENEKSRKEITTPNCREKCSGCGVVDCKIKNSMKADK
ncbi:MAG: TIGR03960 family B12-binding radical SAM protein [Ruminococcaceae bacterium]|nr:TIGR03960 family B12-binding radical SAM protein [Oscillospiraceae bacterium]